MPADGEQVLAWFMDSSYLSLNVFLIVVLGNRKRI